MRLLLDANLSPKRIGSALARRGHDVVGLASDLRLEGLTDPKVLALAAEQSRILITRNSRDFAPLLRQWAEGGLHHSGCILIWTLDHDQFGPIVRGVGQLLDDHPSSPDWTDLTLTV